MTGKYVLQEKDLFEKAAKLKRFEYSRLGKGLKAQTDIEKKQYHELYSKKINKKSTPKENNKSDLIYDTKHSFYKYYRSSEDYDKSSPKSKALVLHDFLNGVYKFSDLIPQNNNTTKRNKGV